MEADHLDRSPAIRKLLAEGLTEWQRDRALEQLAEGTITFTHAAELADMNVGEFAQLIEAHDIPWVSGEHVEGDLESV